MRGFGDKLQQSQEFRIHGVPMISGAAWGCQGYLSIWMGLKNCVPQFWLWKNWKIMIINQNLEEHQCQTNPVNKHSPNRNKGILGHFPFAKHHVWRNGEVHPEWMEHSPLWALPLNSVFSSYIYFGYSEPKQTQHFCSRPLCLNNDFKAQNGHPKTIKLAKVVSNSPSFPKKNGFRTSTGGQAWKPEKQKHHDAICLDLSIPILQVQNDLRHTSIKISAISPVAEEILPFFTL